ncbi:MAG: transposase [Methylococcales bacterium]
MAEDLTQDGNDLHQLAPMLDKAQEILQSEHLTGLADSGYYEGNQLKACEEKNITVYVAIPDKSQVLAEQGRFTRDEFNYDAEHDCYICPQEQRLTRTGKPHKKNNNGLIRYQSKACDCRACPLRAQCLTEPAKVKQIQRWEEEAVIERHRKRMQQNPGTMKQRAAPAEHPFGVLKQRAGMSHFLMRGLEKCRGEFSLMVLAYNLT